MVGRDPMVSLASSLQGTSAGYALLLGSGVSRSAGVMTGWEVALELVRRVARLEGETTEIEDPLAWYSEHHNEDVDYSMILETLAPSQGDRQNLLRPYLEASDDERDQGLKQPTAAHRAIAELVRAGHIRIIVTTNFDRLIEGAIRDVGIEPLIVSTSADAAEVPPLHSVRCLVVKVHGDLESPNLKNTLSELATYEPGLVELLTVIFRDYGLVICGWSAEWDAALRTLVIDSQPRTLATFWAHRTDPTGPALDVVRARAPIPIPIEDADSFFSNLASKVFALDELTSRAPSSPSLAAAELKRFLVDPVRRIRLQDLVMGEVELVIAATEPSKMPTGGPIDVESYMRRVADIERACETLIALLSTLGHYGDESRHDDLAQGAIERLATRPRESSGLVVLIELQDYPALLALFALGLGALSARRPKMIARVLARVSLQKNDGPVRLGYGLAPSHVLDGQAINDAREDRRKTPTSDHVFERLRTPIQPLIADDAMYQDFFDDLEYLLGLDAWDGTEGWGPVGRFLWRRANHYGRASRDRIVDQDADTLLESGMFAGNAARLTDVHAGYETFLNGIFI